MYLKTWQRDHGILVINGVKSEVPEDEKSKSQEMEKVDKVEALPPSNVEDEKERQKMLERIDAAQHKYGNSSAAEIRDILEMDKISKMPSKTPAKAVMLQIEGEAVDHLSSNKDLGSFQDQAILSLTRAKGGCFIFFIHIVHIYMYIYIIFIHICTIHIYMYIY